MGEREGEQRAEQQLEGSRAGAVVDAGRVLARRVEPEHRRQREHRQHGQHDGHRPPGSLEHLEGDHDHDREHQVELLLDRERPEVQHRRRGAEELGVGLARGDEAPVGHVEQRGQHVAPQGGELARGGHEVAEGDDAEQAQQRGRHQPAVATPPEVPEADGPGTRVLPDEQQGDQEAREREEGRDPEEASLRPREPVVEQQHGQHREAPQAFDAGQERDGLAARRAGLGHGEVADDRCPLTHDGRCFARHRGNVTLGPGTVLGT